MTHVSKFKFKFVPNIQDIDKITCKIIFTSIILTRIISSLAIFLISLVKIPKVRKVKKL